MFTQKKARFSARPLGGAAWLTLLLLLVARLSLPLDNWSNNVASTSVRLPGLMLGACDGNGRSLIGGAIWRLRNHPVSEALVAKSSLFAHGDIFSVSRIAELANSVGVGFHYMLNWLETLSVPQQVYAWKLFTGTAATQTFLNKFEGSEQLYGEGTAPRVLQRLKFVLLDGKLDIPSTLGVERLLGEAMEAFKAAFFTFAGELSGAISRTDIIAFEKNLQDNLPLMKEVLAGVLSLCVRLPDEATQEYRTTLGRWIHKLFRVDSAALLLSPLSPPDQVLERKFMAGVAIDTRGDPPVTIQSTASDNTFVGVKQPGRSPPGDSSFTTQQQSAQTLQLTQQHQQEPTMMPSRYSASTTLSGRADQVPPPVAVRLPAGMVDRTSTMTAGPRGGESVRPPSLMTLYNVAKVPAPHGAAVPLSTYASSETLKSYPGMTTAATFASATGDGVPIRTVRGRRPEETLASSFGRRDTSTMREQANATLSRNSMSTQGTFSVPGTDTLTSMAAMLRAEAAFNNHPLWESGRLNATSTTTSTSDPQQTYALDGYIVDGRLGPTIATGRTVSGGNMHLQSITTGLPFSAAATRREILDKGRATTAGGVSLRGSDRGTPAGHTISHLTKLTEDTVRGVGGQTSTRARPVQQPGYHAESTPDASKGGNALRAGLPLSATELKVRMRNMDKVMQTAIQQGTLDTATEGTLRRRAGAADQPTVNGALATEAAAMTSHRSPVSLHEGTGSSALTANSLSPASGGGWGTAASFAATARKTLPTSKVDRDQSLTTSTVHRKGTLPAPAVHKGETLFRHKEHSEDGNLLTLLNPPAAGAKMLKTFATEGAALEALTTAKAAAVRSTGATPAKDAAARATQTISEIEGKGKPRGTSTSDTGRGALPSPNAAFGGGTFKATSTGDAGRQPAATALRDAWGFGAGETVPSVAKTERPRTTETLVSGATERETLQKTPATGVAEQSTLQTPTRTAGLGNQTSRVVPSEEEPLFAYTGCTETEHLPMRQTLPAHGTPAFVGAGTKLGAASESPAPAYRNTLPPLAVVGGLVSTPADAAKQESIDSLSPTKQKTRSSPTAYRRWGTLPVPSDNVKDKKVDPLTSAKQGTLSPLAADDGRGMRATPADGVPKQGTVATSIGLAGQEPLEPSTGHAEVQSPGAPKEHVIDETLAKPVGSAEARPPEKAELPGWVDQ